MENLGGLHDLDDAGCADTRADAEAVRFLQEFLHNSLQPTIYGAGCLARRGSMGVVTLQIQTVQLMMFFSPLRVHLTVFWSALENLRPHPCSG